MVTVFTAGAAAAAFGAVQAGTTAELFAGSAALSGGFGAGIGIAAGALSGAAGSIASQGAGIALGVRDEFDWKQVGLGALGGAVGSGLSGVNFPGAAGSFGNVTIRAVAGNALTQGLAVATGLQPSFSWKGVVATALGASVGGVAVDMAMDMAATVGMLTGAGSVAGHLLPDVLSGVVRSAVTGLVSNSLAAGHMAGKIDLVAAAAGIALT